MLITPGTVTPWRNADLLPNAAPVVSDAALDAFYAARGGARACQRDAYDAKIAAGLAAAFAVMLTETGR